MDANETSDAFCNMKVVFAVRQTSFAAALNVVPLLGFAVIGLHVNLEFSKGLPETLYLKERQYY